MAGHVLADTVEDDDGVVHAVASYDEQPHDEHRVHFQIDDPPKDREYAQDHEEVVEQGQYGADTIAMRLGHPAEGVPHEEHDEHRGGSQRVECSSDGFLGHDGGNGVELNPAPLHAQEFLQVALDDLPLR